MADDEELKGEKGTDGLKRLSGKRVLVTQADDYMGPATLELFAAEGAELIADTSDLTVPGAAEAAALRASRFRGSPRGGAPRDGMRRESPR